MLHLQTPTAQSVACHFCNTRIVFIFHNEHEGINIPTCNEHERINDEDGTGASRSCFQSDVESELSLCDTENFACSSDASEGSGNSGVQENSECELDSEMDNQDRSALYTASAITAANFDALLLGYFKKHNTSEAAKDDLLKLFHLALPEENNAATSAHSFNKRHHTFVLQHAHCRLCPVCHQELEDGQGLCQNEECEEENFRSVMLLPTTSETTT